MALILGMDLFVFIAWIGTIIAALFCVLIGLYYELIKKDDTNNKSSENKQKSNKEA
jgi:predicted outer membrane lipoprotein